MGTEADAPTPAAPPDAIASPEALDAAAAAATTGAGAPPPAPAPSSEPAAPPVGGSGDGAPSVQDFVDDESLDLDSSDLPAQTKDEIKKLRREVRGVKDVARSWQQATEGWHESDIELLRTALVQGRTNPEGIGEWMLNQAKTLLGDRYDEAVGVATEPEPQVGDPDGKGGALTTADVERLVNERIEAERQEQRITAQVETLRQQTEDLGFGPTHPLHFALLSIAKTQTSGNLAAAAEQLRSGLATGVDPNTADDSQPGAGGQPQPGAGHTPAATNGGTPAGTQRPESPRAAAEERLSKVLGNARGFNDLKR